MGQLNRPSGQKHRVNVGSRKSGLLQANVYPRLDAVGKTLGMTDQILAPHPRFQALLDPIQRDAGFRRLRQPYLDAFDIHRKRVAALLVEHPHQTVEQFRLLRLVTHLTYFPDDFRVIHAVDARPRREVVEIARRDVDILPLHRRTIAQQRHHDTEAEIPIEIGAADADAVVGQVVVLALGVAMPLRRQPNDRKVRRSAADIGDQRDFLGRDLTFVVERRCDRLELKRDVVKADLPGDIAQSRLRLGVAGRIVVDEVDRAAMYDIAQLVSDGLFRAPLHRTDIVGDDITEADALAADAGGLVDQRRAEHRFDAAHQSPGVALDIGLDGAPADMGAGIGFVEDRAWNRDVIALERSQHGTIANDRAERRVRRPEIQTANRHSRSKKRTSVYKLWSVRSSTILHRRRSAACNTPFRTFSSRPRSRGRGVDRAADHPLHLGVRQKQIVVDDAPAHVGRIDHAHPEPSDRGLLGAADPRHPTGDLR